MALPQRPGCSQGRDGDQHDDAGNRVGDLGWRDPSKDHIQGDSRQAHTNRNADQEDDGLVGQPEDVDSGAVHDAPSWGGYDDELKNIIEYYVTFVNEAAQEVSGTLSAQRNKIKIVDELHMIGGVF